MNEINPHQRTQRVFLRVLGPIVGLVFIIVAFVDFFSSTNDFQSPQLFWCFFVGVPILFVGLVMCKFAFMGKVARYAAGELAPVGRDVVNYMGREARPGIRAASSAYFEGQAQEQGESIEERIRRLEDMKRQGLINEEDFEEQKDRILSEL